MHGREQRLPRVGHMAGRERADRRIDRDYDVGLRTQQIERQRIDRRAIHQNALAQ